MSTRKRVSYSLATPARPLPVLGLPPPIHDVGRYAPSYAVYPARAGEGEGEGEGEDHPRHCLGVTALALDTETVLAGHEAPQGILYTGGRDGLVASWEQGVPMRRGARLGGEEPVKWERIGVADEDTEDEDDEFAFIGEGGRAAGDVVDPVGREESPRWTVDKEAIRGALGAPKFRQSLQTHTDWVNDLLLINHGRTVITASSDRSIRAWQPHSQDPQQQPALVGVHRDYVKCLAYAPHTSLLFSGGLDRRINVWDVHSPKPYEPITSLAVSGEQDGVGNGGDKGSVYALSSNKQGTLLASGTPERVIRLWDPRVQPGAGGRSSAGQLVGHTDNVKALLMSEDGRYMLSASSDTTVKLWSLAAQRAIHTFTHHTAPIWSLASSHPALERFFSGDRAGHLCVTDLRGITTDWGQGTCTLLAKSERRRGERDGTQGIVRIGCLEDEVVWTATASADVVRWRDVGKDGPNREERRVESYGPSAPTTGILGSQNPFLNESRDAKVVAFAPSPLAATVDTTNGTPLAPCGIPYASMVSLGVTESSSPYASAARGSVSHGASLYTASAVSLPREGERPAQGHARGPSQASQSPFVRAAASFRDPGEVARVQFENRDVASEAVPLRREGEAVIRGRPGLIRAKVLNDRQHVLALDTTAKVSIWNMVRGVCLGTFEEAEIERIYQAHHGLVHNADGEIDAKEALDLIAEQIDGQSFVRQWCQVDTRNGNITVHLEEATCWDGEVYADQVGYADDPVFRPEDRINLGKWVLANLFAGLIKAESAEAAQEQQATFTSNSPRGAAEPTLHRGSAPTYIALDSAAPGRQRFRSQSSVSGSGSMTPGGLMVGLATPAATPAILPADWPQGTTAPNLEAWGNRGRTNGNGTHLGNTLSTIPQSPVLGGNVATPTPGALSAAKSPRAEANNGKDYFSFPSKKSKATTPGPIVTKDLSPTRRPDSAGVQTPGGSQASFMGKFKGFGGKKRAGDVPATPSGNDAPLMSPREGEDIADNALKADDKDAEQLQGLEEIRSRPFNPPFYSDAPPFDFPENTAVIISETNQDAGAWAVTYRSMVSRVERDLEAVEMAAPAWLLDYLFTGRTKALEPKKLTFILEPWPDAEEQDKLPALPTSTSRLSAVQSVRVGKIIAYVCPRIDHSAVSRRGSGASVSSGRIRPVTAPAKIEASQADGMTVSPLSAKGPGKFMAVEQAAAAAANHMSQDSLAIGGSTYPADAMELLCNGVVVPLDMTLAAVKHFIWNNPGVHGRRGPGLDLPSAADVVLHYRVKKDGL